jgi:hypothetical protein
MIDPRPLAVAAAGGARIVIIVALHGVRIERLRLDHRVGADPRATSCPVSYLVPLMALLDLASALIVRRPRA